MAKETTPKRRKPTFLRKDWHKMIKLGSTVKKNRKWRASKGRHGKIRLERKGHARKPKIGWASPKNQANKIRNLLPIRVENVRDLESIQKGQGALIAKVGKKKRAQIIESATKKKIIILNKYPGEQNAAQ